MKHLIIFLLTGMILLNACSPKQEDEEVNKYIPRDKMILILADIQINEGYIYHLKKNRKKSKDTAMLYYEKVFKKHQVSPVEFEESLEWYRKDFEDLELLYSEVITRLNELKAKNEELILQMKADSARADSIARAEFVLDSIQRHADSLQALIEKEKDSLRLD